MISRAFLAGAFAITIAGCSANLNEGSSRVGVVPEAEGEKTTKFTDYGSVFFAPGEVGSDGSLKDRVIQPKENFSVTLVSAFICDFREATLSGLLFDTSNAGAKPCGDPASTGAAAATTRGEVAIVANIIERNGTNEPAKSYNDLTQAGRVVYYSEDIRETGQLINAVNLPLYGPIKYNKGAVYMKFSILEFDEEENNQARGLLSKMQEIGTQTSLFAAAPVVSVLNSLGDALIAQNKDDVELLFEIQLDPPSTASNVYRAPLLEGYYVLMRQENRSQDTAEFVATKAKNGIHLCRNIGLLTTDAECKKVYRGQTWMLIRVSREDQDVALANNSGQAFEAFHKRMLEIAASDLATTNASLAAFTDEGSASRQALQTLFQRWGITSDDEDEPPKPTPAPTPPVTGGEAPIE